MRKSWVSAEQMVMILQEEDQSSVAAAAKKDKVSESSIYSWRKHFGQVEAADVKQLMEVPPPVM